VRVVTVGRAALPALACALALAAAPGAARAASTCGRPDLIDTVPPDGATNVPPNASLFAHYDSTAEYLGEDVVLTPPGGGEEVVKVAFDPAQGLLTWAPSQALAPGDYTLRWPALRGLNAASAGRGATVKFTVGAQPDVAAPVFEGLTKVTWDLERRKNSCTDSLENRMVFDLELAPADDDGGSDGLTLVVFQTAGGSVDGGSVPVLSRAMPAAGKPAQVKLTVAEATGHVCFAALARDLTGQTSNGGSQEVCVETTAPPFFRGCAAAPTGGGPGSLALILAAILTTLAARSRRTTR
jgi:hypothetical protein